jgi:hypothetical protein
MRFFRNKKKRWKRMLLCVLAIFIAVIVFALFYYNKALPEALQIADTMEKSGNDYYFNGDSNVGFIIFSGSKVDEKAYAYMAKLLHEAGHTVVIPNFPIHMSALGTNHGIEIMDENPNIEKWFLIGHSIGGLPISRIAAQNPPKLQGVAFLASYMIMDLSDLDISAIRILASNDEVMDKKRMEEHLDYLPQNSISAVIEGANHQGFGAYASPFNRNGEATISWKEQQEQAIHMILDFFSAQIAENDLEGGN